ncbi:hypothetical protein DFH08DRAFT_940723 [Mycena albidolilacea]|uniref:Uncharacterized protein n=1 Tax=Mycena albidolilacea TaxID=1033008 RepID=A0AAD7EJQ2_9AGAR|nr:hypothetical protein DFH08DRAFT_940723 [Mycena albidolilacea]
MRQRRAQQLLSLPLIAVSQLKGFASHEKGCSRSKARELQSQAFSEELEQHELKKLATDFIRNQSKIYNTPKILMPYKTRDQTFEMYACPLWDWAMDIVQDRRLADFFCWDAEQCYIFDGTKWQCFYTEPCTAEAMWEIQSKLPKSIDNKLLPYILYADKAKLSSFGTQKGYPVVARLANVVVGLRNGSDWGGGQIVAWLPVVEEDPLESGKPGYVNFKNTVWHEAFYKLLESIVLASKTGVMTKCGDNRDEQSELSKHADLRTSKESKDTVMQARELNVEDREELLKSRGLRNVDNVFWNVAYSDPHQALSFEHLHSYSSGLWGKHLFERRMAAETDKHYQKLSLYVTMKLQTADRIHDGEEEFKNFGCLLKHQDGTAATNQDVGDSPWYCGVVVH